MSKRDENINLKSQALYQQRSNWVSSSQRVFRVSHAIAMITQYDVMSVIQFSFKSVSVLYSDYQVRLIELTSPDQDNMSPNDKCNKIECDKIDKI